MLHCGRIGLMSSESLTMTNGSKPEPGYRSETIGKQDLQGPAIDLLANASDSNTAAKIDNRKWYEAIVRNRSRLDRFHERLLND
jgi:hypothetical protein